MASSPVHRGFAVVMGIPVSGVYYQLAGTWSNNEWKGMLKGEMTMTPEAEIIEHRHPTTGARCGTTYFNQSRKLSITFIPGDGTPSGGAGTAITASQIDIIPGVQIGLHGTDPLVTSNDTTFTADQLYIVESAQRTSSATAETVWNLSIARYGDGKGYNGSNNLGDVIGS